MRISPDRLQKLQSILTRLHNNTSSTSPESSSFQNFSGAISEATDIVSEKLCPINVELGHGRSTPGFLVQKQFTEYAALVLPENIEIPNRLKITSSHPDILAIGFNEYCRTRDESKIHLYICASILLSYHSNSDRTSEYVRIAESDLCILHRIFVMFFSDICPPSESSSELPSSPVDHPGKKLKHMRQSAQLTVQELADNTGISYSMISLVERGMKKFTPFTASKIAEALGCEPTLFLPITSTARKQKKRYSARQGISLDPGKLTQARLAIPITQAELSQRVNCHQSRIARLESGRTRVVKADTARLIAEALNVDLESLLNKSK